MPSILENLLGQLTGDSLDQVGQAIGADKGQAWNAIGAALPVLLGALSRNAKSNDGAEALTNALAKDHDGSVLDNLQGFLGQGQASSAAGILRHIFGGKQSQVENSLSKTTGLDRGTVLKLLLILAPIVMGMLGKKRKQSGLAARDVADLLGREEDDLERRSPRSKSLLGGLLDQDGDGDFDLSDITKGVLGKLF